MRQHRATYHVTDCPNIRQVRAAICINSDEATLVFSQAYSFRIQSIGIWHTANRYNQFIVSIRFGFATNFVIHSNRFAVIADFVDFHTQQDAHALFFGQDFECFACNLLIGIGQECWHRFQYSHIRTQAIPNRAHFQTNHARTNQTQFGRHFGQIQCAFIVQNGLIVHISTWQWARHRTCSDDDMFGFNHRFFTLVIHFNLPQITVLTF